MRDEKVTERHPAVAVMRGRERKLLVAAVDCQRKKNYGGEKSKQYCYLIKQSARFLITADQKPS